ncbi:aminopyrimidine aminohydrolase [Skermanella aerolata]|uniref:Aminopyrimidine aminohydrolase n=1 Tax=Skermanella aerolata TaxID=393310 RepID=A0A512DJN4_9PROT|nr:TenA family protein [Skermanella aerolata]GEO36400.1 aminopyrimidine aminohydrolase [Skermanella aerolata]
MIPAETTPPAAEGFSLTIRARNKDAWDAMVGHRFVQDVRADRLPDAVFQRYLRYEHAFVETAVTVFAQALAKASTTDQRRRLATVLHGLVFDQIDYFEAVFRDLRMAPTDEAGASLPDGAKGLRDGALALAANGSLPEILAGMLAAEWAYETWCTEASSHPISHPSLKAWVDLHVGGAFAEQVVWLRAEIDAAALTASPALLTAMETAFRRTLELELPFHDAPYR